MKKILILILSSTLLLSMVGCGNNKEIEFREVTPQKIELVEKESTKVEINEDSILKLGIKQSNDIKAIVERYGVTTDYGVETCYDQKDRVVLYFSKDPTDCSPQGTYGYSVFHVTDGDININDGGNHIYSIGYSSCIDEEDRSLSYHYSISVDYPNKQEFKIEDFKMLNELYLSHFENSNDVSLIEKSIQDHINKIDNGEIDQLDTDFIDIGSYRFKVIGGEKESGLDSSEFRHISFIIELKELNNN